MRMRHHLIALMSTLCLGITGIAAAEDFAGPFPSWANVKTDYGAVGDGKADDTGAIQKALDDLHQENRKRHVLYIPAGTYRITRTLVLARTRHAESMHVAIFGEDPDTTTLRWDGPSGGTILDYSAWYSRLGRLTLDGMGKAKTAIAHGNPFVTYNEMSDLVIRDVDFGIEAGAPGGQGIAETAVLRCRFLRCIKAGVSIQNFNSLDWWIWHSRFEDCGTGITNTFGAGNFHVYQSVFLRSRIADASIGNTEYFSLRHNTSIGSKAFFVAGGISASGNITLQGNTILDPQDTPIQIGNHGPLLLLDNVIRTAKPPAVRVNPAAGFVSAGNQFTMVDPISARQGIRFDDTIVPPSSIRIAEPTLPGTPPRFAGPIIEVPAGSKADAIQQAIAQADQHWGRRPVIHLPAGHYAIDRTLDIPPHSDLQLIGDGGYTQLNWAGDGAGPVLRLRGPTHATLRDLSISGANRVDGLAIEQCDQPGARIFMDQANVSGAKAIGFLVDRLDNADVSLHNFEHGSCKLGVKVIGGPQAASGKPAPGRVAIFGGASSNHELAYDITDGGTLLASDIWYETGQFPHFLHLAGAGTFTLHGSKVAVPQKGGEPAILFDDFRGSATFMTTTFVGGDARPAPILVKGPGQRTSLLLLGVLVGMGDDYLLNQSPHANVALRESFIYTPGGGSKPIADRGQNDARFVQDLIRHTRSQRPKPLDTLAPDTTDIRVHRLLVSNARACILLRPS